MKETEEEIAKQIPVEKFILDLLSKWDAKGAYTGDEVKTIVAGNIRTFATHMLEHLDATLVDVREQLAAKERALQSAYEKEHVVANKMSEFALHQVFTREVSTFHRQFLIPLVAFAKGIIDQAEQAAQQDKVKAAQVAQMKKFLKAVEDRTKHFENQSLVAKAHQNAADSLNRMTVKTGLSGETGEVKVHTTDELVAGTHAPTCAKASNHALRCDCHLASNYPPP